MPENSETNIELVDFGQLTVADLEAQLNTEFAVDLNFLGLAMDGTPLRSDAYPAGADLRLELTEVTRRKPLSPDTNQEPCTLLFRGSHEMPLWSDVHVLVHESLGNLAMLLTSVNVSPGVLPDNHPEGRFYESVIG